MMEESQQSEPSVPTEEQNEREFPGILERVKAIFTDYLIIALLMLGFTEIFSRFDHLPNAVRISAFVFIFLFYAPLSVSFLGGTPGHLAMKLRVRQDKHEHKKIALHNAFLRFIVKSSLGWISLLTISGNAKKRALHDFAGGSVVLYKRVN